MTQNGILYSQLQLWVHVLCFFLIISNNNGVFVYICLQPASIMQQFSIIEVNSQISTFSRGVISFWTLVSLEVIKLNTLHM